MIKYLPRLFWYSAVFIQKSIIGIARFTFSWTCGLFRFSSWLKGPHTGAIKTVVGCCLSSMSITFF